MFLSRKHPKEQLEILANLKEHKLGQFGRQIFDSSQYVQEMMKQNNVPDIPVPPSRKQYNRPDPEILQTQEVYRQQYKRPDHESSRYEVFDLKEQE